MDGPSVQTKHGKLKGAVQVNIDGGEYISFRGIPFAEPPVEKLRFKEPQPLKPWTGIRDAIKESKMGAQIDVYSNEVYGGDDCLYLDVSTNSLTGNRPVIVWIHGGAFQNSSNTYKKYSPDYLLKKDIVFVSTNYRLGILGFLNMGHDECAGNQGLKDLMAALIWVKNNIEQFGGDPNNVTIFGESAGGAAVHALCLTPRAKGLFHKAIMQSGVVFNPWAHVISNQHTGYAVAKALGKECSTPLEVIEFLRTIPAGDLVKIYKNIHEMDNVQMKFQQVPSSDSTQINPVFPNSFSEMKNTKINIPIIMGYNSHEGILLLLPNFNGILDGIDTDFPEFINRYLNINDKEKLLKISKVVREYYFGNDSIVLPNKTNEIVQLMGDLGFVNNIHECIDNQMQANSKTYFYKFSYRPNYPSMKEKFKVNIEGTCHADEIGCIFFAEQRRSKLLEGTRDRLSMERMTTMWTNFAKFGDPTPIVDEIITTKWLPLEKNKKNCLEINDNLVCHETSDDKKWKMWKSLLA